MNVSLDLFEAYLYFNGHVLMLLLLISWECMRSFLTRRNINHGDDRLLGPTQSIGLFVVVMILVMLGCVGVFMALLENLSRTWPPIIPVIVYPIAILLVLAYLGMLNDLWERVKGMLNVWRKPRFQDLFLADLLSSIPKVFANVVCSLFRWFNGSGGRTAWQDDGMCGDHFILVTAAMSLPFTIRLIQCIREWNRKSALNAAKYTLSIGVLVFGALEAAKKIGRVPFC
ncbi:uncharacterized protein LOC113272986 [Papaver somniferum]|uniref:uncharacterized protein LOC113272986 n=1 Tax=Papaver somniferum TaxID=3469 RepID=UPI000E6F4B85|nr:uncharacterized protein LOC113272986 [Papaver somniferum]